MNENSNKNIVSRRWFLAALSAATTGATSAKSQGFDFLGTNSTSDFNFIAEGGNLRPSGNNQPINDCGSKDAAMHQRTPNSRPIVQQRYYGSAPIGSIEVSISNATLYHVIGHGVVNAYPIGAGDDSRSLIGKALNIGRKSSWPTWTPTANIARRTGISQTTKPGGPCNPLGAFALYLYNNGVDTIYRIHGTNDPQSIGKPNVSSGCIRMYNEDVVYLQKSIAKGAKVSVHAGPVPGINNHLSNYRPNN